MDIVLVEDEEGIRDIVRFELEDLDCTLVELSHKDDPITKIVQLPPAVVVSDVRMPGLSGLDILTSLRTQGYENPFILISGDAELDLTGVEGARNSFFLAKPWDDDALLQLIQQQTSAS